MYVCVCCVQARAHCVIHEYKTDHLIEQTVRMRDAKILRNNNQRTNEMYSVYLSSFSQYTLSLNYSCLFPRTYMRLFIAECTKESVSQSVGDDHR